MQKFSLNQLKRTLRRRLPRSLFNAIQGVRRLTYRPPRQIAGLRSTFECLQTQVSGPGAMLLRPEIEIRIDPESSEPFTWFCWRSPDMVKELDLFIERVRGARTFADIGSNHGVFSLVFLKLNPLGRVLSVEPSPVANGILLANRSLNGMDSSMLVHSVACGDQEGEVKIHFNWHHLEVCGSGDESSETLVVPQRTLDSLCRESELIPEVVKIDVEGFELQVLRGADETLQLASTLFLEIHPELLEQMGCQSIGNL